MNIVLTTICNRSCPYCFAKGKLVSGSDPKGSYITLKDLRIIIKYARKAGLRHVRVVGGEPTLHSRFKEAIELILKHGLSITMFSNGIIRKDTIAFLEGLDRDKVHMLLNVNARESYNKREYQAIQRTMRVLNGRIALGFNINFLIGFIKKYKLQKRIRLGIAAPLFGQNNEYLPLKHHRRVSPRIVRFAKKCDTEDIGLAFDCGFTLCSFSEKEIGQLFYCNSPLSAECNLPIDVGPDLIVWACFATSMIWNKKLTDFGDLGEAQEYYGKKTKAFSRLGQYPECFKCKQLERKQCSGGCLGHLLTSFSPGERMRLLKLR